MADHNQTVVRARIDSSLKQRAEEMLKAQHLDLSKASASSLKLWCAIGNACRRSLRRTTPGIAG